MAQNVGHINVLRIIRETGGCAVTVSDEAIGKVIRDGMAGRRFAWSPEGAATLAALPELADRGSIRPKRSRRPGQHGLRREVSPDDPLASRWRSLGGCRCFRAFSNSDQTLSNGEKD